jgi:4-hydroxybenzoate polyprenyltransferase
MIFLFFFLMVLTNTILFDIRDIRGDSVFGIHTLPVLLGIPATKNICYILVAAASIMIIPLVSMNRESFLLVPCACTVALSTHFVPERENPPWWYFGILVDGEYWILLFSTLLIIILL